MHPPQLSPISSCAVTVLLSKQITLLFRSLASKRIAEIVAALFSFCHQLHQELQHDKI